MSVIRISAPQIQVPALEAPRLQRLDVSTGLKAVAHGFAELARAQRITQVNEAQIGFADAFRDLDENVRRAPWQEKRALFDQGAKDIRARWLGGVSDPQVRQALAPEFDRTYSTYLVHTRDDAFKGETAWNIASTQDAMDRFAQQAAVARSPQERDMIVGNGAALCDHLVIGGYIDDVQRRKMVAGFLNNVDTASAQAAIADPARDPAATGKALRDGTTYPHLAPEQIKPLVGLAEAEAARRRSVASADANTTDAAAAQEAPGVIRDDVMSRLTTGRPLAAERLAVIARLPAAGQAQYNALKDGADAIFRTVGDLRTKSLDEIAGALDKLKPLGAGPYAQAQAFVEQIKADRARDPAAAARDAVPLVANAWVAYGDSGTPQDLQAAARASQAAQTALGIPEAEQRLVPRDLAEDEARTILNAKPEDQLRALRDVKARYGAYAPALLRQIDHFFSPQLREADAQASPLAGELKWREAVEQNENSPVTEKGVS